MSAVWFVLLLPLFGFTLLALGPRVPKALVSAIGPLVVGLAFIGAIWMFIWDSTLKGSARVHDIVAYTWIVSGHFKVDFGAFIDPLSCTLALIITGVGFLILVYSVGYMHGDIDYRRFFCYMDLFIFAMLLLVLSDNFLFLLVGWAGVGLTSYLLIGFWYDRPAAVAAARQALVVNVIGDWGMMVAAFILFRHFKTLQYLPIFSHAHSVLNFDGSTVRLITHLLADSCCGQVGSASPPCLASERHGRSDAGQCFDPRRNDGYGRGVFDRSVLSSLSPGPIHGVDRHHHRHSRGTFRGHLCAREQRH